MSVVAAPPHTNDTAGAGRIAVAFAAARAAGRAALIPYVVAGYPDAETSFAVACAAIDNGADLLEVGLPYSDPLADGATLQRASQGALANGATFDRSLALAGRIAAARPNVPVVAMGYANQLIGGGDGRDRAQALARAGVAGVIVADLTPDEGGPFEAVAAEAGIAVVYLVAPTSAGPRRAAVAARLSRTRGRVQAHLVGRLGGAAERAHGRDPGLHAPVRRAEHDPDRPAVDPVHEIPAQRGARVAPAEVLALLPHHLVQPGQRHPLDLAPGGVDHRFADFSGGERLHGLLPVQSVVPA